MRRTRKVTSNGWWYWLARHKEEGLVLLDAYDQCGLREEQLRAYILDLHSTKVFDRSAFKACLGGEVSDTEFVKLMNMYNSFKDAAGRPLKAPPEVAHANFLAGKGLPAQDVRKTTRTRGNRLTHCYSCKVPLDSSVDIECTACNWIICSCGACGCGWAG